MFSITMKTIYNLFIILNCTFINDAFSTVRTYANLNRNKFISDKSLPILYQNSHSVNNLSLEHIFPKCYIKKPHQDDLHNIFTASKYINNIRSNYKFTTIENISNNTNIIKINNNIIDSKKRLFVPNNECKGIIARAILYMCNQYGYQLNKVIDKKLLIYWCLEFKPSIKEINHNKYVYNQQARNNIFISEYYKDHYLDIIDKLIIEINKK